MNIIIGRYNCPSDAERQASPDVNFPADRWESWVEPEDKSWIVFVAADGTPAVWLDRDENGGVIGEPVTR